MIERVYLQWIGTSSYPTIDSFVEDVRRVGVCKKLPNKAVAKEVADHVTVIFLAHDQGRFKQCLQCAELAVCPACNGACEIDGQRCEWCHGLGSYERGTGGQAIVDGETWSYTRLLQLKKNKHHDFWKSEHTFGKVWYCPACGGRGKLPLGVVFGFFVPFWVVRAEDGETARRLEPDSDVGGYFAVAPTEDVAIKRGKNPNLPEALRLDIESLVGKCSYYGDFGLLDRSIPYEGKHFRGVKKWEPIRLNAEEEGRDPLEGIV